ncbi:MAG: pyridoxal-phosphate dependent enzyme, partial [Oscillospiraceae bacterium]|nr:pyridoxal-phosphate dependent enzyme [Oscillospiraceae bacterium]
KVPDYVALSTGDGCTIAGVWKGFKDLYEVGLIEKLPRLISVQASGCCPINRAIEEDRPWRPMEENTLADSIAVGVPRNPDKAIRAIKESNGLTVEVSDEEIRDAMRVLGRNCGVFGEPAGVTATAGVIKASSQGLLPKDAAVVSIVSGNGLKDAANGIKAAGEPIKLPPDMDMLRKAIG